MEMLLANESDVVEGQQKDIDFAGRPVILVRKNGKVHAYINVCTHLGGPCKLQGDVLHCEWHGSDFEIETGKALNPPAPKDSKLVKLPIVIKEGKIFYKYP